MAKSDPQPQGRDAGPLQVLVSALRAWQENPRSIAPAALEQLKQALLADSAMLWARPLLALPDGT